jgi:hypothetical protein
MNLGRSTDLGSFHLEPILSHDSLVGGSGGLNFDVDELM